jgi:hypothetical protein
VSEPQDSTRNKLGIFVDLHEKLLAAYDYPHSLIFSVDETGLTVVQKKTKNPRAQKQTSDWRFNCDIKGFFNSN